MRPMVPPRWLVVVACCLVAAVPAGAAPPMARLAAPSDGAALAAGELAWLAWEPTAEMARRPGILEWEAFLSLDGGASFPFRITPHLEISDSRVLFRVPGFASDDVRLLLRFGDERTEHTVELSERFTISAGRGMPGDTTAARTGRRGEAARPGEPGTVFWIEGDRQGRNLRPMQAGGDELALGCRPGPALWAVFFATTSPPSSPQLSPPEPAPRARTVASTAAPNRAGSRVPRSRPILSLHQRLNT